MRNQELAATLRHMSNSPAYAVRRNILADAADAIERFERENAELSKECESLRLLVPTTAQQMVYESLLRKYEAAEKQNAELKKELDIHKKRNTELKKEYPYD